MIKYSLLLFMHRNFIECIKIYQRLIKLEGEKSYREAIKQINSNLRVLASEMVEVIVVNHSDNEMFDRASTSDNY